MTQAQREAIRDQWERAADAVKAALDAWSEADTEETPTPVDADEDDTRVQLHRTHSAALYNATWWRHRADGATEVESSRHARTADARRTWSAFAPIRVDDD